MYIIIDRTSRRHIVESRRAAHHHHHHTPPAYILFKSERVAVWHIAAHLLFIAETTYTMQTRKQNSSRYEVQQASPLHLVPVGRALDYFAHYFNTSI